MKYIFFFLKSPSKNKKTCPILNFAKGKQLQNFNFLFFFFFLVCVCV